MKPNRELAVKILNKLIETNRLKKPGCEWDTTIGIVTFILDQECRQCWEAGVLNHENNRETNQS